LVCSLLSKLRLAIIGLWTQHAAWEQTTENTYYILVFAAGVLHIASNFFVHLFECPVRGQTLFFQKNSVNPLFILQLVDGSTEEMKKLLHKSVEQWYVYIHV